MTTVQDFEKALNAAVQAERLSQSKMTTLVEVAMQLMDHDTQLVSIMYRNHKSLLPSSKISSLYAFDALSRAARQQVIKHNLPERHGTGNCATFLLKVAGVLEGLFQDMLASGVPEAKDKTKKIYDIWVKGRTFPPSILSRLSDIVSGKDKELGVNVSSTVDSPQTNSVISTQSSTASTTTDSKMTLLALLAQAAGQQMLAQTAANTVASTAADSTHILLQHLQSASVNSTAASELSPTTSQLVSDTSVVLQSSADPRIPKLSTASDTEQVRGRPNPRNNNYRSPRRDERYRDRGYDDREYSRNDQRDNLRRRGRWNRWDERERDYGRNVYRGSSRSRSPEGQFHQRMSHTISPRRRRQFSPDVRNSDGSPTSRTTGKDEFGRDLRPPSPEKSPTPKPVFRHSSPDTSSSAPRDPEAEFSSTSTSNDSMSRSSSIAANTCSKDHVASSTSVESNTKTKTLSGLDKFDMSMFDPTSPASWEALGKMWEATNGYTPSMEELMQFVMIGAMGDSVQSKDWQQQCTVGFHGAKGYGGGHGRATVPQGYAGFHGNSRNNHHEWSNSGEEVEGRSTDAIVLGGSELNSEVSGDEAKASSGARAGGKMQKVGDKWVFVRNDHTA